MLLLCDWMGSARARKQFCTTAGLMRVESRSSGSKVSLTNIGIGLQRPRLSASRTPPRGWKRPGHKRLFDGRSRDPAANISVGTAMSADRTNASALAAETAPQSLALGGRRDNRPPGLKTSRVHWRALSLSATTGLDRVRCSVWVTAALLRLAATLRTFRQVRPITSPDRGFCRHLQRIFHSRFVRPPRFLSRYLQLDCR